MTEQEAKEKIAGPLLYISVLEADIKVLIKALKGFGIFIEKDGLTVCPVCGEHSGQHGVGCGYTHTFSTHKDD